MVVKLSTDSPRDSKSVDSVEGVWDQLRRQHDTDQNGYHGTTMERGVPLVFPKAMMPSQPKGRGAGGTSPWSISETNSPKKRSS